MALFKNNGKVKNFNVGDLVFDEYYGAGVVIDLDESFGEMEVRFRKPDDCVWLTSWSLDNLQIVSKAKHRKRHRLQ